MAVTDTERGDCVSSSVIGEHWQHYCAVIGYTASSLNAQTPPNDPPLSRINVWYTTVATPFAAVWLASHSSSLYIFYPPRVKLSTWFSYSTEKNLQASVTQVFTGRMLFLNSVEAQKETQSTITENHPLALSSLNPLREGTPLPLHWLTHASTILIKKWTNLRQFLLHASQNKSDLSSWASITANDHSWKSIHMEPCQ